MFNGTCWRLADRLPIHKVISCFLTKVTRPHLHWHLFVNENCASKHVDKIIPLPFVNWQQTFLNESNMVFDGKAQFWDLYNGAQKFWICNIYQTPGSGNGLKKWPLQCCVNRSHTGRLIMWCSPTVQWI